MIKVGDKIRIVHIDGEPLYSGRVGVVDHIDNIGQIHGSWVVVLFFLVLTNLK